MARSFAITAPANSVDLAGKTTADVTLTVTNQTERALRGTARLVAIEPTRREWLKVVDGEEERSFAAKGTHQYKVRIEVPAETPKGTYAFRMDFVSSENPDEDSTPGPAIGLKVAEAGAPPSKFPFWIIPVAAVVLLAVGLGLFFALRGGGEETPETVAVPELKGKTVEEANQALGELGLVSQLGEPREQAGAAPGTVVDQKPPAGEALAKGGSVELFPQAVPPPAPEELPVPSVVGRRLDSAKVALFEAGFTPKVGAPRFTGGDPDLVVAQTPPGNGKAARGAVVEIVPEKESVVVPNVVRKTISEALVALKQAKLDWEPLEEATTAAPAGTVIKQTPAPGSRAEQDSVVKVTLAKAPGRITVIPLPAVLHRADLEKIHRIAVPAIKDYISVSDVSPNPANVAAGGRVVVTVNYATQHGGKARITVTPLSGGRTTTGGSTLAAVTEPDGRGEAKLLLRVYAKMPVKVDTLLVRLLGPDGKVLQEVKRPVSLTFYGSFIKGFGN